jgi:hypothetical protein
VYVQIAASMSDDATVTRRTVLRTTAASAAAVVGAVGTASADHIYAGDCVRLTADYQSYKDACPNRNYGPIFEKGERGRAWEFCTTDEGQEMVYFEEETGDSDEGVGWVAHDYLEKC